MPRNNKIRPTLSPRNPVKRSPGMTQEQHIYDFWQRIRRQSYYWNGENWYRREDGKWVGATPLMALARHFKMPIREIRVILAAEKARREASRGT